MPRVYLSEAVAWVESRGEIHAVRFEPHVYRRLLARWKRDETIRRLFEEARHANRWPHFITTRTIAVWLAQSWGMYQIMGYNIYAYELYAGPLWAFLQDRTAQHTAFQRFIERKGFQNLPMDEIDADTLIAFARYYNGPRNPRSYALRLREAAMALRGES